MPRARFDDETLDGHVQLIAVSGELDSTNVADLRRRVGAALAAGRTRLVVDLERVTHMDSSALAELIACQERAREQRGGLALVVTSPAIRRTLEIRGVGAVFTIAGSREEALAAL